MSGSGPGPLIAVYADESCLGNGREGDNPGGAGSLLEFLHPRTGSLVRRDLWISERATTNNRMALRSVIEAFTALSRRGRTCRVVFTSDSRYLIDGMTAWVHGWAARGWQRKGGAILNLELWCEAVDAARAHPTEWRWVRGHDGHIQNEYANHLATRAAAGQTASGGLVESGFEGWLEQARARGAFLAPENPFPGEGSFRPARELPHCATARLV